MIYLDNNATTALDERVLDTMLPYLREEYGNASSVQHASGRYANHAIESARNHICQRLHIDPKELYFTSGATESINWVIKGIAQRYRSKGKHIITCQTEHKATLSACQQLEKQGYQITYLPVDGSGNIDLDELESLITSETILVSLMYANNETGLIHPVEKIAEICQSKDCLFFCDATQYVGKEAWVDLFAIPIDLLCFSAHKFHGPKGIGALYVRRKRKPIQIEPLIVGGNQESALRGGTYNVPAIVGLGKACELFDAETVPEMRKRRDLFETLITKNLEGITINAARAYRLANTSNLTIKHVNNNELISQIPDIAISTGSACVTGLRDPSHVLKSMGLADEDAYCSIRVSLSRFTTFEDIAKATDTICTAVQKIRNGSPIWDLYQKGLLD